MTTFTVTNTNDSGAGSLRQAIADADNSAGADTIKFASALAGQTITITSGELVVNSEISIDGDIVGSDNRADITISAAGSSRVFFANGGANLTFESLNITGGNADGGFDPVDGYGGAIYNYGTIHITYSTISGSSASNAGGGIYNANTLTVSNSTFTGNYGSFGGAIGSQADTSISNTTITGNSSGYGRAAAIYANGGILSIESSTIVGNYRGGIELANSVTANFKNSVLANNDFYEVFALYGSGSALTATNCVFGGNISFITATGSGNIFKPSYESLGLGTLGDHGGPVDTIDIIRSSSILINAGNNGILTSGLVFDADGNPRIYGTIVDIGATEYQNTVPAITSSNFIVRENSLSAGVITATDTENDTLHFSISGGDDRNLFKIDSDTGTLTFLAAPDFEHPTDASGDNIYEIEVTVDDGKGGTDTETVTVAVKNINDRPDITSDGSKLRASIDVAENSTAVTKVLAEDDEGSAISYAISGGDDKALFSINATTGRVTFKAAPDFEAPQDRDHDNAYQITVRATDSDGAIDVQYLTINVTDVDGVTITGTENADKVNAKSTVDGQPLPTGEEDHILGLGGNDRLSGLGGDDILEGGEGKDILKGGAGHDHFVYLDVADSTGTGIDRIRDFSQGEDSIDLSAIDADGAGGVFHFLGEAGFDGTAGALRQRTTGSDVFLEGDTDGNGVADLVIILKGSAGLVLTDADLFLGLNV